MNILSSLQIINIDAICLHEDHEPQRLDKTCKAIQQSGELCHPPIAMQMRDGRYLILDGAHRTGALQRMGCKRIPVQLARAEDIMLEAWDHIVSAGPWLSALKQQGHVYEDVRSHDQPAIVTITADDGSTYCLAPRNDKAHCWQRLEIWHQIVDSYSRHGAVTRVAQNSSAVLEKGQVRVTSPVYTMAELEEVVLAGKTMPAGVTRFKINGRLLNLKIPLHWLADPMFDSEEWESYLSGRASSIRLYSESIYLCEA